MDRATRCVWGLGLALTDLGLWILLLSGISWLVTIAGDSGHLGHPNYTSDLVGTGLVGVGIVALFFTSVHGDRGAEDW